MNETAQRELSVVVPVYNEIGCLDPLVERVGQALDRVGYVPHAHRSDDTEQVRRREERSLLLRQHVREAELERLVLKQKRLLEQGWDVIVMLNALGEITFVSASLPVFFAAATVSAVLPDLV